ncbi:MULTISPECIES: flagellar biosynthesis protein FliQ [unclassified Sedimentibacter]|uniref:flagellar biosynthesis protein FliQ n=1 Tax=unclassified Sedimentibacter TaxID=2649220 RepID=UPI0027E102AA|nr:flagellar biosynthesis protein FliQ [Sedimentibacter sp. MB35-C1]WMJ78612.1 flagellar biosynthesis protein FliQ [Sedimentibacter sp. MB35-C1]
MSISLAMEVMQAAAGAAIKVGAPILLVSLTIGLVIAVFQAATQIHEQTLTFVPKLFVTAIILIIMGPWMAEIMSDFTHYVFDLMLTVY